MKSWFTTYTILMMFEGEDAEEAKAAAQRFAEKEGFNYLLYDIEVEEVKE